VRRWYPVPPGFVTAACAHAVSLLPLPKVAGEDFSPAPAITKAGARNRYQPDEESREAIKAHYLTPTEGTRLSFVMNIRAPILRWPIHGRVAQLAERYRRKPDEGALHHPAEHAVQRSAVRIRPLPPHFMRLWRNGSRGSLRGCSRKGWGFESPQAHQASLGSHVPRGRLCLASTVWRVRNPSGPPKIGRYPAEGRKPDGAGFAAAAR
jgi:hypothetical protein